MILALLYLIPTLLLFTLLMICFTGSFSCGPWVILHFPFTPVLRWMKWPWGNIVSGGMFTGPLWGRIFILSSIGLNAGLLFYGAKLSEWLLSGQCDHPRHVARQMLSRLNLQKGRWLNQRPKVATIVVLLYLVPALFLWIKWQACSGWKWLCSAPLLEYFARPWADWLGWHAVAHSTVSVEASLGVLGARIFVLAALFLNAGIIFYLVRFYQWMFGRSRHDPPQLVGTTVATTYALVALFIYVDEISCGGWLCDLGLILAAAPWSLLTDAHFRGSWTFVLLLMLAANAVILYAVFVWLARLLWKVKRIVSE